MPKNRNAVSKYTDDLQIVEKAVVELRRLNRPNLSAYCRDRNIPHLYHRIRRALAGRDNKTTRAPTNKRLDDEQEAALERFVDGIDAVGFGVTRELVQQRADMLLAASFGGDGDPPRVGEQWASRWLNSHTKYYRAKAKPIDLARKLAQQPDAVQAWFDKLVELKQRLEISDANTYNMDETGVRIGVAKSSYVWSQRGREILIPTATNRELVTLQECCCADGSVISPMVILAGKSILEQWAVDLPDKYLITVTSTGYANDHTAYDWIQHFHRSTARKAGQQWRLLLVDGHGSHLTAEIAEYAASRRIQLYALIPHLSHLLQPLDVGCFQPLKWYHGRTLDWASRTGAKDIRRSDFLATLSQIRRLAFTERTVSSGWRRTGLAPFKPEVVVKPLRAQEAVEEAERKSLEAREVNEGSVEPLSVHHSSNLPSNWVTPKTERQLRSQEYIVAATLRKRLSEAIADAILCTLKGSSQLAYNAAAFESALHRTEAARNAREERRRRSRRVVQPGGGAIYAKDCRTMAAQRAVNEARQEELTVEHRQTKAIQKCLNAWRKICSNIRNWGKKSSKRHAQGLLITRARPFMEDPAYSAKIVQSYTKSLAKINQRVNGLQFSRIQKSVQPAVEVAYASLKFMDPYSVLIHSAQRVTNDGRDVGDAIIEVSDSQELVQETQYTQESEYSEMGGSSPCPMGDSETIFEFTNALESPPGY